MSNSEQAQTIIDEVVSIGPSIWASTVILLISSVVYIVSMVQGRSRPNQITRLVVFLTMVVSVLSLEYDGSNIGLWVAWTMMMRSGIILLFSLKYGSKNTSKIDYPSLVIALFALVTLYLTENPLLGIILFVVVDTVGYLPAYVKTWKDPKSEGSGFYFWELVALLPVLFSSSSTMNDLIFAGYLACSISCMLFLIYRPSLLKLVDKGNS